MAQTNNSGITILEAPAADDPIAVDPEPVAAFLGRAAAGPVDQAVRITGMTQFDRVFGGDWSGSTLGLTLSQYFQHGGREAWVVRIASDASCGVVELPTRGAPLRLHARNPGSRERLRVSVDYDGVADDADAFNLTIQRLDFASGRIADQEIFRALSPRADARRFIGRALEASAVVRPGTSAAGVDRPLPMRTTITNPAIGYVGMATQGADGAALTDYDLIGSDRHGTGMFALDAVANIDFLYACGDSGLSAAGPAFRYAAERYCASRNAMLIVDPPAGSDPLTVPSRDGVARQHGHCAITYYPPLRHREGTTPVPLPAAGALAGLLARQDLRCHVWSALADDLRQNSAALHRDWLPWQPLETDAALRLLRAGINPLLTGTQRRLLFPGLVTCANGSDRRRGSLVRQRLAQFILGRIERGTRWAVFAPAGPTTWARVQAQVAAFLGALEARGAFEGGDAAGWSVRCDAATNAEHGDAVRLLVAFCPRGAGRPQMYSIVQHRDGTSACRAAFEYPAA